MSAIIFNFHDSVLLATAFQSLVFVLLILVLKRDLHQSDFFLIFFFLAHAAIPAHLLILYGSAVREVALNASPNLFRIFDIAYWLEGPILLWYTRSLLIKEFRFRNKDFFYLLPAIVYLVYNLLTFFSWDESVKIAHIEEFVGLLAPSVPHFIEAVRELIFVAFGVLCLLEIRHAQQQVHHRYSNIEKVDLYWLGLFVLAFMVLRSWTLLVVAIAFIKPDLGPATFNSMGLVGNYLMFAVINGLVFFSLSRSDLLVGKISRQKDDSKSDEIGIDPKLTARIKEHMETNKPYLSHYLNLDELANQLSMHPRALSVAIKNGFNTNFYEFINSYRIQEAKRLIEDTDVPGRTMIEISGDAGFNSKATFNSFFKKMVGMTPTQYRNSLSA